MHFWERNAREKDIRMTFLLASLCSSFFILLFYLCNSLQIQSVADTTIRSLGKHNCSLSWSFSTSSIVFQCKNVYIRIHYVVMFDVMEGIEYAYRKSNAVMLTVKRMLIVTFFACLKRDHSKFCVRKIHSSCVIYWHTKNIK